MKMQNRGATFSAREACIYLEELFLSPEPDCQEHNKHISSGTNSNADDGTIRPEGGRTSFVEAVY